MTALLLADTAEKKPYNLLGVEYERRHLLIGDYASAHQCVNVYANTWMPRFSIERKSVADYLNSWFSRNKANGYNAGHAERNKMRIAKQYSKTLGYECRFWYCVDGGCTEFENALRSSHWRRWKNDSGTDGLTIEMVYAQMATLRLAGYHVIPSHHKLDAEMQTVALLRAFDAKYGAVQEWKGAE